MPVVTPQLRAAENLMAGELHKKCKVYSEAIAELLALVEAGIDFSDQEDIEFIDSDRLASGIKDICSQIEILLKDSESWQDLHNLARVALVGPPNAGKSCLINSLTGLDRSIVCSIAGTTRDILSAPVKLEMGECLLIDTPGLGDVDDPLGESSQKRVIEILKSADLVILLWDPADSAGLAAIVESVREYSQARLLVVANKKDVYLGEKKPQFCVGGIETALHISAQTGENTDILLEMIAEQLHFSENANRAESVALTTRQSTALINTVECLKKLSGMLDDGIFETELIALELREGLDYIGSISGEIASDDVLGKIFSQFCIGK